MILSGKRKQNNAGFTLVEMIVVLIVLGILASAAVYGIISYINLTRYNTNQENAESVYQSVQASLNHMSENGTLESWAKNLSETIGTADEYDSNNPAASETSDNIYNEGYFNFFGSDLDTNSLPGQSAHMRYTVTYHPSYTPGNTDSQSKCIYDLIYQEFKSTDILKGLITVEFDVEKALDATGTLRYSASVYSVFYDSTRTVWDAVAKNNIDTLKVPFRDENYRSSTSLVGYIAGRNGQMVVDSVFVPAEAEVNDFTIRNGETLDITWSVNSDGQPVTGKPDHIHYTFALYDDDKRNVLNQKPFSYLVVNENSLFEGKPYETLYSKGFYEVLKFSDDTNPLYMAKDTFQDGLTRSLDFATHTGTEHFTVVYTKESVTDKRGIPLTVYRASVHTTGKVFVHNVTSNTDNFNYNNDWNNVKESDKYYEFPLTISYEIYDAYGTTISEKLSYTLSLDSMMSRNVLDIATTGNWTTTRLYNFSINRLINGNKNFLTSNSLPVNIFVSMAAESDDFGSTHQTFNRATAYASDILYADRALDDPVYYVSEGKYSYVRNAAYREAGRGYAVVNSYFGDLGKGSDGTKPSENSNGGVTTFDQDSVITCYRHLYNIRMLDSHTGYDHYYYRIQRDLNWYTIDKHLGTEKYYSDVVVYSAVSGGTSLSRYSPVPIPAPSNDPASRKLYGDQLAVVSFPSIYNLKAKSVLIAEENSLTGETSVINNVQMRLSSFFNKNNIATNLNGFGLININRGTIINIRANGMTLTLDNKPEGSPDDRAAIAQAVALMLSGEIYSFEPVTFQPSSPIGGLVGTNVGKVGSDEDLPVEENTIRFSNCITTSLFRDASDNWHLYRVSACGGIVGDNGSSAVGGNHTGYMHGHLEATGHFVSAGMYDVASVLGYSMSNIDAFIRVDNRESDQDKIIVDTGSISSMLYCTCDAVGGAIGSISSCNLIQNSKIARLTASADDRGVLTVLEDPLYNSPNPLNSHEYAVDVYLDANSYILCKTDDGSDKTEAREAGIGGIIGRINTYKGGDISMHVVNHGVIAASNSTRYIKNLGGAVGIITGGSVKEANIIVMNENDSRIGTIDGTTAYGYTHTTGGAVGKITGIARVDENSNIIISSINNGAIFGDCTHNGPQHNTAGDKNTGGIGGAVGAITGAQNTIPKCNIRAFNNGTLIGSTNSLPITDAAYNNSGLGGAAGYIQYMPKESNIYSILKEGKVIRANGNNAGGCVGCQTGVLQSPGDSYTHITADLMDGSSVAATASNAGGAIGNARYVTSRMQIRAIISGSVTVKASADAGGTCGLYRSGSNSDNSEIILQQGSGSSYLYVRAHNVSTGVCDIGNENAGGLIGFVTSGDSELKSQLSIPSQLSGDQIIINVESYNNAGGMIGHLYNERSTNPDMIMNIHPMMQVHAINENAGGMIGFLEQRNNFRSNVTVKDASNINSDYTPVIKADVSNAGGLIGGCIFYNSFTGNLLLDSANIAINGGNNVGGCIGYAAREAGISTRASITGSVTVKGTTKQRTAGPSCIVISGSECIGGVVGRTDNVDIHAPILCDVEMIVISGTSSNVGGCFGRLEKGNFNTNSGHIGSITFTGTSATILGVDNIGGCVGLALDIGNISGNITFSGESSTIKGTGSCVGGCIGIVSGNCKIQSTSLTGFNGKSTAIEGDDNVGGVIGLISAGSTDNNTKITYAGESCTIKGDENVGGVIGMTDNHSGKATVTFSPVTSCTVSGNNNLGGCIGTISETSYDPFNKKLVVTLTDCTAYINGSGCAGGVVGRLKGAKTFAGSTVTLNDSTYGVTSADSACGGHIGFMDGMVIGDGGELTTTCNNGSEFNISGKTAAGGIIGLADSNVSAKKMLITLNGSSTMSIQAMGNNSGAGALIGINDATFSGPNENSSVANASGLSISAPNGGYAGFLIGINNDTFQGRGKTYTLNASIGNCENSAEAPENQVIGSNNGTHKNYYYKISGVTYHIT